MRGGSRRSGGRAVMVTQWRPWRLTVRAGGDGAENTTTGWGPTGWTLPARTSNLLYHLCVPSFAAMYSSEGSGLDPDRMRASSNAKITIFTRGNLLEMVVSQQWRSWRKISPRRIKQIFKVRFIYPKFCFFFKKKKGC